MHRIKIAAAVLIAITTQSVNAIAVKAQAPRIRDSVGIRIVENASRLKAPVAFTLGAKPSVDVGGVESDPEKEINSRPGYPRVIRLNDGRIAILDVTRVQFFDANGKRLHVSGRSGGGPGEFLHPVALCGTRGDTVLVADSETRRISAIGKSGDVSVQTALVGRVSAENAFCFDDGTFITVESQPNTARGESVLRINHLGRSGSVINRVVDFNTGVFDMLVIRESSVVALGSSVFVGNALAHEVREYAANGILRALIRTDDETASVSRSELEKIPPKVYRPGATEAERRADARRFAASSKTKNWPTYGRILPDLSGRIWVQDWSAVENRDPDGWTAFDKTGKLLGRLVVPAGASKEKATRVVHFGKDEVFVTRYDDDGALHYTAYPLQPRK